MEWILLALKWLGIFFASCVAMVILMACWLIAKDWAERTQSKTAEVIEFVLMLPEYALGAMLAIGTLGPIIIIGLLWYPIDRLLHRSN